MPNSLTLVPYGPAAIDALAGAVERVKAGSNLAPVTVAVPSRYVGLSLRRELARRKAATNVSFEPLPALARLLGAPGLVEGGRAPLTQSVRTEAVRVCLEAGPGVFGGTARHPATVRSLAIAFTRLRRLDDPGLADVATSTAHGPDLVRLFAEFRRRTAAFYDDVDLLEAAAAALRSGGGGRRELGAVVVHLPHDLAGPELGLVEALADTTGASVLLGLTGDDRVDEPVRRLAVGLERRLGIAHEPVPTPMVPTATSVLVAPDADEEVRSAVRGVLERAGAGVPFQRMAVLCSLPDPYLRLAHEHFASAGVPVSGPSTRSLAASVAGRTLVAGLRLAPHFRRRDVLAWLSSAPIVESPGGRPVPVAEWEAISRSANVVGGPEQWSQRLQQHARRRRSDARRAAARAVDGSREGGSLQRPHPTGELQAEAEAEACDRLEAFVHELVERADPSSCRTWGSLAAWGGQLLDRYLGHPSGQQRWCPEEAEAEQRVRGVLRALALLDHLGAEPDVGNLCVVLEDELSAGCGRVGRFGEGVFVGQVGEVAGASFDVVFVIGMAEGAIPLQRRSDPLLATTDDLVGGAGQGPGQRLLDERRSFLALLADAPERVLSFARADQRNQSENLPSQWLLESASSLAGTPVWSDHLVVGRDEPWLTVLPSFPSAVAGAVEPVNGIERDLQVLGRWVGEAELDRHPLVSGTPALARGVACAQQRASARLTRWDGVVGPSPDALPVDPLSPTALEQWGECPFRHLLDRRLGVAETVEPEDTVVLSARDRGSLVHEALERFLREALGRPSQRRWDHEDRVRLAAIADELCDRAEAEGLSGRPLLWRIERRRIQRDLRGFLDADDAWRARNEVVPAEVELGFGVGDDDHGPLELHLGDGRALRFRGRIDRVDQHEHTSRLSVFDYKTGKADDYRNLPEQLRRGRRLQLPLYAKAAADRLGAPVDRASYWFVTERGRYCQEHIELGADTEEDLRRTVTVIADGIGAGVHPANPGDEVWRGHEHCRHCPYDRVCPADRGRQWARKQQDAAAAPYVELSEGGAA